MSSASLAGLENAWATSPLSMMLKFGGPEMRSIDRLDETALLSPAEAMRDLEAVTVGSDVAASIRTGLPLDRVPLGATGEGPWAMLDGAGTLLAIYEATGTDRIRPAVVVAGD